MFFRACWLHRPHPYWEVADVSRANCGFASMSIQRRREIASRGGVAAHLKGTAHKWTKQEAREASLKGRRHPRATRSGHTAVRQADVPPPSGLNLDAQPPSPWLESLRKNLEDLFASQKRAAVDVTPQTPSREIPL
jgi:hypothetical protein